MDANNNLSAVTEGQINALLGSDTSSFEALIAQLMSPRNEDRGQAEQLFNLCRARHLDTFLLKLVFSLRSSSSPDVRSMAAVLLRKQLGSWSQLNIQTQALIKEQLQFSKRRTTAYRKSYVIRLQRWQLIYQRRHHGLSYCHSYSNV